MDEAPFKTLAEVAELSEANGREVLTEFYGDDPILIVKAKPGDDGVLLVTTSEDGYPTDQWDSGVDKTEAGAVKSPFMYLADGGSIIVPVVKSDRNPFSGMIIVGRASNNDVRLASSNISKVHAFVKQLEGAWVLEDRSSTNGTTVNSVRLEPNVDHKLNYGDEIGFGDVPCMFMDADRLFTLCSLVKRQAD